MPAPNRYLDEVIPALYRREAMHLLIYSFVDCYRMLYPSVTIQEASEAFCRRYDILEDNYKATSVAAIYNKVMEDLEDAVKRKKAKEGQIRQSTKPV
jgi:hypothetical protein